MADMSTSPFVWSFEQVPALDLPTQMNAHRKLVGKFDGADRIERLHMLDLVHPRVCIVTKAASGCLLDRLDLRLEQDGSITLHTSYDTKADVIASAEIQSFSMMNVPVESIELSASQAQRLFSGSLMEEFAESVFFAQMTLSEAWGYVASDRHRPQVLQ